MPGKEDIDALWAEFNRKLSADPKLAETLDSIEKTIGTTTDDEPRPRLRTPYANANTVGNNNAIWK
ncbi:MAG: hypothetical protein FWD68_15825 [Alphaproteobacteria bacterium]|nr:hypothetical protein [Alphaproteobacteria bacterium]